MEITEKKFNDILALEVNFERATFRNAESFKEVVHKSIYEGSQKIVIDLSICEFMDSTFLGALVESMKFMTKNQGELRLVGFKPAIQAMFELTRIFKVFDTFQTLEDAVNSFKETANESNKNK